MVDPNTRQGKRTPVTLKIKFKSETLEQFIERYAVDVSQGGIFIRTKEPLAVGTQMKFEFQLRDASPLIGGEGTVVWTRENDPSRPAIAPGMGVRFDRLADGSQSVLERILSEKAKQAPNRAPSETTKPPMFTDVPTRVAPAPIQDALLGNETKRRRSESYNDQHTPLPKPMPFHSDADEFPDEAFEEATKVRALDELIAATAGSESADARQLNQDLSAARRARNDATHSDPAQTEAAVASERAASASVLVRPSGQIPVPTPTPLPVAAYSASGPNAAPFPMAERDSAPVLPSPPERVQPKLLDTSPSPRTVGEGGPHISGPVMGNVGAASFGVAPESAKTRIGLEPARAHTPSTAPPSIRAAETRPSGMRAVAAEETSPSRLPAKKKSSAGLIVALLLLVAVGGGAAWWFVIRPRMAQKAADAGTGSGSGSAAVVDNGSAGSAGSGSAAPMVQNGSNGSGSAAVPAPKAELVDTVIGSSIEKSTVAVAGTDQAGPAPLTAKLEKGKAYKAHVSAPGYLGVDIDVTGGDAKQTAKLQPKPHVVSATSDPAGALIYVDGAPTGHATPFDIELSKAQAAKKTVRVQLRKSGFKAIDKVIDAAAYIEVDEQLVAKVEGKLAVAPANVPIPLQPMPPTHDGSGAAPGPGSADGGPVTSPGGGSATATPPEPKPEPKVEPPPEPKPVEPKPEPKAPSDQPQKPAAEPEPTFNK